VQITAKLEAKKLGECCQKVPRTAHSFLGPGNEMIIAKKIGKFYSTGGLFMLVYSSVSVTRMESKLRLLAFASDVKPVIRLD
jgi:hypothetical protein